MVGVFGRGVGVVGVVWRVVLEGGCDPGGYWDEETRGGTLVSREVGLVDGNEGGTES